jgi:hypothetical protein
MLVENRNAMDLSKQIPHALFISLLLISIVYTYLYVNNKCGVSTMFNKHISNVPTMGQKM